MTALNFDLYECHITCRVSQAEEAEKVAQAHNWKTSQIMRDVTLGDDPYFYLTCHERNCPKMYTKLETTVKALKAAGIEVVREKIERIIYDTKIRSVPEGI